MPRGGRLAVRLLLGAALVAAHPASAAGHGDAPRIAQDPQANLTDVYAFVGTRYDDPGQTVLNVLVSVRPFAMPGDGVYARFADDALYSIHLVDPVTAAPILRYDFHFSDAAPLAPPGLKSADTIFSYGAGAESGPILAVGDARQNYTQTFEVQRREASQKRGKPLLLASGLATPPPNVGLRTTPLYNDGATGKAVSGAASFAELDGYTGATLHPLPDGEVAFAGPREDGFYGDAAGFSDSLDPRLFAPDGTGQSGGGPDTFRSANVLVYAIQIPLERLPARPFTSPITGAGSGLGVYASVSRGSRKLRKDGTQVSKKLGVQVNRMGNPLFNQLLVPLAEKDEYNRTSPEQDAHFEAHALEPELASLLNAALSAGFVATGRSDLAALFLPDVLRVDLTTGPVRLPGQVGFSRLGFFGGDTAGAVSSGWPNGRRPGDDVVDILFTAVASGPAFGPIVLLGDNVAANDQLFHQVFPYLATPHSGANP